MQNTGYENGWALNDECRELLDAAKHLASLLDGERKQNLLKDLSVADRKIADINHYIEFSQLGVVEGYKAYRLLRNTLKERREIKMELEIYEKIREFSFGSKAMRKFLSGCDGDVVPKIYIPREMPELFTKEMSCSPSPSSKSSQIISDTANSSATP